MVWAALAVLAAGVAAAGLARDSWRGLTIAVIVFDLACAASVIVLQSIGAVPTTTV